jgi:hypothetical protein
MQIGWSVLWFIVAVSLLVTVHEFGHFWVARKLGFKVLRFSVGFGKPLLKKAAMSACSMNAMARSHPRICRALLPAVRPGRASS